MKQWATHFRSWIHRHHIWVAVVVLAFLVGLGGALYWTIDLVRFGLPPPTGQDCGKILHVGGVQTSSIEAGRQSLDCFWQAYQTCQTATISQTNAGADVGSTNTLTIEVRWNHCVLYGQEERWANADQHTTTFLYTQLTSEGETLQVSACDGIAPFVLAPWRTSKTEQDSSAFLDADFPQRVSHSCGT